MPGGTIITLAVTVTADVLGLGREHLTFEIPGVNHFVWLTQCYYKGKSVFPILDRWIDENALNYWEHSDRSSNLVPKAVDLYQRFGVFPIGDTCTTGGGSWPWWYHTDAETEKRWREDPEGWWDWYFDLLETGVGEIAEVVKETGIRVTDRFPPHISGEVMVPMIEAIACDIPRVIIANIPNTGDFVAGVPHDIVVEIPTVVSKRGVQGIHTHGLPKPLIAYLLRDRVASVNVELEAYETGSQKLLHQLIMMDPWTRSEQQAHDLLGEIMDLPYHEEMRLHYQ